MVPPTRRQDCRPQDVDMTGYPPSYTSSASCSLPFHLGSRPTLPGIRPLLSSIGEPFHASTQYQDLGSGMEIFTPDTGFMDTNNIPNCHGTVVACQERATSPRAMKVAHRTKKLANWQRKPSNKQKGPYNRRRKSVDSASNSSNSSSEDDEGGKESKRIRERQSRYWQAAHLAIIEARLICLGWRGDNVQTKNNGGKSGLRYGKDQVLAEVSRNGLPPTPQVVKRSPSPEDLSVFRHKINQMEAFIKCLPTRDHDSIMEEELVGPLMAAIANLEAAIAGV
ncbi:hypothetical protein BJ546DRAFT_639286 [Cryomyces antarcticus]